MTEPTDEELDSVLCHHWPAFSMQAVLVQMWLRDAMRAALAKWGTPQPVAREPLTAYEIHESIKAFKESENLMGVNHIHVARAIERAPLQKGGSNAE